METILSIKNLHKKYKYVHAVNNVSFDIQKGNVYGILGPNGSGKSTTLGIVLNVVNKTSGDFEWFSGKLTTSEALKKVGAIIERPNFYPYMTAVQNLQLVCKIKGIGFEKVDEKLALVGLLERKDSHFRTFSLGMKQRLAIASALLNDPEILILDEPTNGLDPQGIHQIRDIIKVIAAKGTTILLASHLLDEVEKVCSHVVVLQKGIILYSGRVDAMSSGEGFLEIDSADRKALKSALSDHPGIGNITEEDGKITAVLTQAVGASDINRYLFEKGITVSHLVKRKTSLEEQFLNLTEKSKK
ncbi:ABC transporter ATP-binding protein [Flavobacterium silvaticum]|uniref:ABC transporter ATP-binding protein n=1 Tax=Flavobacterium silvaticum TaxID=1852020 RepID=A0A972JKL1_9FLAO|nr:ABC transporter ATP-binding protein [Flavobacterium silvaticum]NMH29247.1 ABC transporter ATP-binding protein [Flavobacterium silvaticum]